MGRSYAEIKNGNVINRIFQNWETNQSPPLSVGMFLIDVTNVIPFPTEGESLTIKEYAVIQDDVVVNTFMWVEPKAPEFGEKNVVDITDFQIKPYSGWLYSNGKFSEPTPEPIPYIKEMSKYEFMCRFTNIELQNIYLEAKTNIQIEIWLDMYRMAQVVDKQDPNLIAGLEYLELMGKIGVGRAAEILE